MARLSSIEKGGFYALPDEHLPATASLFEGNGGPILDPCAGEGVALEHLAQAWRMTPYANELDFDRAAACVERFGGLNALQGDMYTLKASSNTFPIVWCNPPYTWDAGSDEKRRELAMMQHSFGWVAVGGYILWVVYKQHVTERAAMYLATHCDLVHVWGYPGKHLGEYDQVLVVGRKSVYADRVRGEQNYKAIVEAAYSATILTEQEQPSYSIPKMKEKKTFTFAPEKIDPDFALKILWDKGAQHGKLMNQIVTPAAQIEKTQPIIQPRGGQLGLLLAAGLLNNATIDTEQYGRVAIRSTVDYLKVLADERRDSEGDLTEQTYNYVPVTTTKLLNTSGEIIDISGDTALVDFIRSNKAAMVKYLEDNYKPLYNFDYSELAGYLNSARINGNRLYETQKHVVAALHTALKHRKGVILVGEPGVGKTAMASALISTVVAGPSPLIDTSKNGKVSVILCPPHLVKKWRRELLQLIPDAEVRIIMARAEDDKDVVATGQIRMMMEHAEEYPQQPHIIVMSNMVAKLPEGWGAAWCEKSVHVYDSDNKPTTVTLPICPTCSEKVMRSETEGATPHWLKAKPRYCRHCGSALWQLRRTFSAPRPGQKYPKRDYRYGAANFLKERYGHRIGLFVYDELHEAKGGTTDVNDAMTLLAQKAEKVIGLTGTLYGGKASSLFAIEWAFNPRVIKKYGRGGITQWVKDMGVLQEKVTYTNQYDRSGVLTGKDRNEQKPQEAAGCSPMLVAEVLDHCLFLNISDIGRNMPEFEEIPTPIKMGAELGQYHHKWMGEIYAYLAERIVERDNSFMGAYLRAALTIPNGPSRQRDIIHNKKIRGMYEKDDVIIPHVAASLPGLDPKIYPKEQALIDLVRGELAAGRNVGIFMEQTGEAFDLRQRIAHLLETNVTDCKPFILNSSVEPIKREERLEKELEKGANVFISHPKLVQTGLDLVEFPTLVFYEINYSLYVMQQASRRAWRLIQNNPCKTYYFYYEGTMEERAIGLLAEKKVAADVLYGNSEAGGLNALAEGSGGLISELAKTLNEESVATQNDLTAKFKKNAQKVESDWLIGAGITSEEEAIVEDEIFIPEYQDESYDEDVEYSIVPDVEYHHVEYVKKEIRVKSGDTVIQYAMF